MAHLFLTIILMCISAVFGQFPTECLSTLNIKECCPNDCGESDGRGFCRRLLNGTDGQYENQYPELQQNDDRFNWPHVFFKDGCECKGNYYGVSCSKNSCKWGYTGEKCDQRRTLLRKNIKDLTDDELKQFFTALKKAKTEVSNIQGVVSLSQDIVSGQTPVFSSDMTEYNVFAWMHYYSTRDTRIDFTTDCTVESWQIGHKDFCNINDFAHESSGFPTWHRAFLLLWESMLQKIANNDSMAIPYWDWRDEGSQCSVCTETYMGANNNAGRLSQKSNFSDWKMVCWDDVKYYQDRHICDGVEEENLYIKRAPGTNHNDGVLTLPTSEYIDKILELDEYDTYPYDSTSDNSFRNALEGFLDIENKTSGRHLAHNQVHLFMGLNSTMSRVPPSANDPIFLVHHAFVDYLFETWLRQRARYDQNSKSPILPQFPKSKANIGHNFDESMVPFFPVIKHRDVWKLTFDLGYEYDNIISPAYKCIGCFVIEIYDATEKSINGLYLKDDLTSHSKPVYKHKSAKYVLFSSTRTTWAIGEDLGVRNLTAECKSCPCPLLVPPQKWKFQPNEASLSKSPILRMKCVNDTMSVSPTDSPTTQGPTVTSPAASNRHKQTLHFGIFVALLGVNQGLVL